MPETIVRIVIATERRSGKKVVRLYERDLDANQQLLWDELCDGKTTDPVMRAAMVNAAFAVKREWMAESLRRADISEEMIEKVMARMAERNAKIVTDIATRETSIEGMKQK